MCGIVLMMSNDKLRGAIDRGKAFTQGIVVDTFRGQHSTGLAYVDYEGNAEVYKKPVPGYDFVNLSKYQQIIRDPENYPFMIAHNRYATQGRINTDNAHPFQHGPITGVHNGSLFSWKSLSPNETFDTDSEYIIHALANNDAADVIKEIDGAFTLVWHDARDNTLHAIRNSERPFYMAHIKDKNTVLGASEMEMLELICYRNDLVIEESYSLGEDHEFIFNIDDLHKPEIIKRETTPYYATPAWYNSYNRSGNTSSSSNAGRSASSTDIAANQSSRVGEKVHGVINTAFHSYSVAETDKSSQYGYIGCMELDKKFDEIRIQGMKQSYWAALDTKDGYFTGIINSEGRVNDEKYYLVLLSSVEWQDEKEAYADYHATETRFLTEKEVEERDDPKKESLVSGYIRAGRLYTDKEATAMIACGCGTCGDPVFLMDFNDLEWWNDTPICVDCILDEKTKPDITGI